MTEHRCVHDMLVFTLSEQDLVLNTCAWCKGVEPDFDLSAVME
jgi:hypothetical protein